MGFLKVANFQFNTFLFQKRRIFKFDVLILILLFTVLKNEIPFKLVNFAILKGPKKTFYTTRNEKEKKTDTNFIIQEKISQCSE